MSFRPRRRLSDDDKPEDTEYGEGFIINLDSLAKQTSRRFSGDSTGEKEFLQDTLDLDATSENDIRLVMSKLQEFQNFADFSDRQCAVPRESIDDTSGTLIPIPESDSGSPHNSMSSGIDMDGHADENNEEGSEEEEGSSFLIDLGGVSMTDIQASSMLTVRTGTTQTTSSFSSNVSPSSFENAYFLSDSLEMKGSTKSEPIFRDTKSSNSSGGTWV